MYRSKSARCATEWGNFHSLKVRRYADHLDDINEYLGFDRKTVMTDMNEILLNIMTNSWIKQAYVQGFYCEYITFKKQVNTFECKEISESIYKGVVKPYY